MSRPLTREDRARYERMGRDLKARRVAAGLTAQQLADLMGVHRDTVYGWEAGTSFIRYPAMIDMVLRDYERRRSAI